MNTEQPPQPPEGDEQPQAAEGRRKRVDGHTHAWDSRSLGVIEAAILRMAWGRPGSSSVTENSK